LTTGKRQNKYLPSLTWSSAHFEESSTGELDGIDGSTRNSNLPFFDLSIIIAATDNFSDANKLGQGGFGSIYKVHTTLPQGVLKFA
jgi:hypothetical protein